MQWRLVKSDLKCNDGGTAVAVANTWQESLVALAIGHDND